MASDGAKLEWPLGYVLCFSSQKKASIRHILPAVKLLTLMFTLGALLHA